MFRAWIELQEPWVWKDLEHLPIGLLAVENQASYWGWQPTATGRPVSAKKKFPLGFLSFCWANLSEVLQALRSVSSTDFQLDVPP